MFPFVWLLNLICFLSLFIGLLFLLLSCFRQESKHQTVDNALRTIAQRLESLETQVTRLNNLIKDNVNEVEKNLLALEEQFRLYPRKLDQLDVKQTQMSNDIEELILKLVSQISEIRTQIDLIQKGNRGELTQALDLQEKKLQTTSAPKEITLHQSDERLYETVLSIYNQTKGNRVFIPMSIIVDQLINRRTVGSVKEGRDLVYKLAAKYPGLKIEIVRDIGESVGFIK